MKPGAVPGETHRRQQHHGDLISCGKVCTGKAQLSCFWLTKGRHVTSFSTLCPKSSSRSSCKFTMACDSCETVSTLTLLQLVENTDALWDDGVAPELALDFDAPHISTREALWTWATGFGLFGVLYAFCGFLDSGDDNPALCHSTDAVVPDYSDYSK